jgi:hypothetical protein
MDKLSSYMLRVGDYKGDGYFRIPQHVIPMLREATIFVLVNEEVPPMWTDLVNPRSAYCDRFFFTLPLTVVAQCPSCDHF